MHALGKNSFGIKYKLIIICTLFISGFSIGQTDPCLSQVGLTCELSSTYTLPSATGVLNPTTGPWGTPGSEAIFSFTPITSGTFDIQVTNNNYFVDLFFQTSSCSANGWIYVDDIYASAAYSFNLVAGVTYYFLIDDENTTLSTGIINISCPCFSPPGGIDNSVSILTPLTSIVSNTLSSCNDCNFRSSPDQVLEIEISCPGDYTFTLCEGATWDTYLYLSDQPCGGVVLASNDDDCGLQSTITITLNPGVYYLAIEGFSSVSAGAFDLSISTPCSFTLLPVELVFFEGENQGRENLLSWQTATEHNNDYFIIERSEDGIQFDQITLYPGQGSSNDISNYSFIDDSFEGTKNYYRLTQVDFNGEMETHNTIIVQSESDAELIVYPNPSDGLLTIETNDKSGNSILTIKNSMGQLILNQEFPKSNQIVLELNEDSGVYFVQLQTSNESFIKKIILR